MATKNLKLDEITLDKLNKTDQSILHWSVKFTELSINSRKLESTISTLYESRQKIISEFVESSGIDVQKIKQFHMNENGEIVITLNEEQPQL